MKIRLAVKIGESQQQLRDTLNALLHERFTVSKGGTFTDPDGRFVQTTTGTLSIEGKSIAAELILFTLPNGDLEELLVRRPDRGPLDPSDESAVHTFIHSVFSATLNAKSERFFTRHVSLYYGPILDGEYWLPGFRFAPALSVDPDPHNYEERPVVVDQYVHALDALFAQQVGLIRARRHISRLSLLLDLPMYEADWYRRWAALPNITGSPQQSQRMAIGFTSPTLYQEDMPRKGSLQPVGKYEGLLSDPMSRAGKPLSLPKEIRSVLRTIDNSLEATRLAIDGAASLFRMAKVVERHAPSATLAYTVASVDALTKGVPHACTFGEFMRRYGRNAGVTEELIDFMWGEARSAHFHAGSFGAGEFALSARTGHPFMDADASKRNSKYFHCRRMAHLAMMSWMLEHSSAGGEVATSQES